MKNNKNRIKSYVVQGIIGIVLFIPAIISVLVYIFSDKTGPVPLIISVFFLAAGIILCAIALYKIAGLARDAIKANETGSHFMAHLSHEIRTPINSIMGMDTMIMREGKNNQRIQEYARNIQTAGGMLITLVNDILDTSRIDSGKLAIIPVEYDLFTILCDTYRPMLLRANEKSLELKIQVEPDLFEGLFGDEVRIKQVINNLLSNAVKYTEKGEIIFKISHEKTGDNSINLILEVADTGIGIRPEDMDKIFTPYERLEENRNRRIEGTGLGLSLTRNLVEMMGGTIGVSSVYGEGSVFTVRLPQGVFGEEVIGDFIERMNDLIADRPSSDVVIKAPKARVLAVDDVPMNLKVIEGLLEDTGVETDQASSGKEAIELCRNKKYDLIFMDHMMPEMDGILALDTIRSDEAGLNRETPVIILTANVGQGVREDYIEDGFSGFIPKPVEEMDLKRALARHLPKELITHSSLDTNVTIAMEAKEESKSPQDALNILDESGMVDVKTGLSYCMDRPEFYMDMLREFLRDSRSGELNHLLGIEDWENYRINVHALKNTAMTIGALEFSEECRNLEMACRGADYGFIKENHYNLIEKYAILNSHIAKAIGD